MLMHEKTCVIPILVILLDLLCIAYACSEGSDDPVHSCGLAFFSHTHGNDVDEDQCQKLSISHF